MPLFSSRKHKSYEEKDGNDGGESMLQHFVKLEKGEASTDESAYTKLKQLFAPFVLRRKKEDVLGQLIPPKVRRVEYVELDPVARTLYDSIIADHLKAKKNASEGELSPHLFTQLRKAAHHPLLIRTRNKTAAEKQKLAKLFHAYQAFQGGTLDQVAAELDNFSDFDIHHTALDLVERNGCRRERLEPYILREEDLFCSTKFVRLKSLLPELISAGHRILIFSVWTSCLDLLGCLLETMGIEFLRMDGATPVKDRQDLMDRFQREASIPVFLLSTKACGLGITLTSADVCIMHDIDFNPFNDLQAEDR
jgi:SWI/SNF-related matrix-associated actin-dependent regulator 1 of chromatin subfamily A